VCFACLLFKCTARVEPAVLRVVPATVKTLDFGDVLHAQDDTTSGPVISSQERTSWGGNSFTLGCVCVCVREKIQPVGLSLSLSLSLSLCVCACVPH